MSRRRLLVLIGAALAVLGVTAAIALLAGGGNHRTYQTPSASMEPTLTVGERFDVDQHAYDDSEPQINDIVIFYPPVAKFRRECGDPSTGAGGSSGAACDQPVPKKEDVPVVKRIVAGPGDTLSIQDGHPVVDGEVAQEDFITPCRPSGACNLPKQITIPPDHYFVMGDNRGASDDSRLYGPLPRDWIIGRVEQ
jgi:signal peptidase I